MGSTRLPGKVALEIGGRPALVLMLERILGAADTTVVATSTQAVDDEVVALAQSVGVPVVRGPEDDVLRRFALALDAHPADTLIRLTADCPFADPALIREAVNMHHDTGADYTSNTLIRTYPDGLDVEVMTADSFLIACSEAFDFTEREHVTPFVVRRPERFALRAFRTDLLLGDLRWTLDTQDDLRELRDIATAVPDVVSATWGTFLAHIDPAPDNSPSLRLRPAIASDSDMAATLRNDPEAYRFFRQPAPVSDADHREWYIRHLFDPSTRIWTGVVNSTPVGQVRIAVTAGRAIVSIGVLPDFRGEGFSSRMLSRLLDALHADFQVRRLVADVHPENPASFAAFAGAGFRETASIDGFRRLERSVR